MPSAPTCTQCLFTRQPSVIGNKHMFQCNCGCVAGSPMAVIPLQYDLFGRAVGQPMPKQRHSRRLLPIVFPLWLPWHTHKHVLSRLSSALLPPWAVIPLGALSCSVWLLPRRSLVCHLRCAPASPHPRQHWHAFAVLLGPPTNVVAPPAVRLCFCPGPAACAYSCSAPIRPVHRGAVADARLGLA